MTKQEFNALIRQLFGDVLQPFGFTCEHSQLCTFTRQVSDEVYHMIVPDRLSGHTSYRVFVFPTARVLLGPLFDARFPDQIGDSTGGTFLNERHGVSGTYDSFSCKHEQVMRDGFERRVKPALIHGAVPHLDQISTLGDMLPVVRNELSRGLILFHLGNLSEGRKIIQQECERLGLRKNRRDSLAIEMVQYIDNLLVQ
jgi:hypothetical protein